MAFSAQCTSNAGRFAF